MYKAASRMRQDAGVEPARQWRPRLRVTGGAGHRCSEERGDERFVSEGISPDGEPKGVPGRGGLGGIATTRHRSSFAVLLHAKVFF